MYQHDLNVICKGQIYFLSCSSCGFSAEYCDGNLIVKSIGDETARHKGIYFELTEKNEFIPVYLVQKINEIIKAADRR